MPLLEQGTRTNDGHQSNWMPYKLHDAAHRGMPIDTRRQVPVQIIVGLIRILEERRLARKGSFRAVTCVVASPGLARFPKVSDVFRKRLLSESRPVGRKKGDFVLPSRYLF